VNSIHICKRFKNCVTGRLLGDDLRARAMRGGVCLGGGSVAEQAVRFARNMILTRILAPSAFGAMAIVMSSSAVVGALTEVGLKHAIIQNPKGGEKDYLDTGWWMGLSRALFTYLIIFAIAPWVARIYGVEDLSTLLRVTLLGTLFDGAMSPRSALAQRHMKFGRWMIINNGGCMSGVILTVVLSYVVHDVWALAIGFGSENAFRCILSYIFYPGIPSLRIDTCAAQDLYTFSKQAFGLSFMNLIFSRADIFVLGKLCSTTQLGLYSIGVALVTTPSGFITNMLSQTLIPALSHVQQDKLRLNRILNEVTSWLIMLGLPSVAVVCLCGASLLTVVYGERYVSSAASLAVAAVVVFLNILNAAITCVFIAVGRPGLHRRAVAASAIVMLIATYPACKLFGIVGGQIAALLGISVSYILQLTRIIKLTELNLIHYRRSIGKAMFVTSGIVAISYGAHLIGIELRPITTVILGFAGCIIAYICAISLHMQNRHHARI
jgi:O-antigen/teichoic acid export membrane protein